MRYQWSKLNRIQKGTFGEYFAKMEFTMYGFEVYTSEVDDRGIDFVVRHGNGAFLEVQVKSVSDNNLQFVNASKFKQSDQFVVLLVRLTELFEPQLYLFLGTDWPSSDGLLVYSPYEGKKSEAAYEIRLAKSRNEILETYNFDTRVKQIGA